MTNALTVTITRSTNSVSPSSFKDDNLSPMALEPFKATSDVGESKTFEEDESTSHNETLEAEKKSDAVSPNGTAQPAGTNGSPTDAVAQQIKEKETLESPTNVVSPSTANVASATTSTSSMKGSSAVKSLDRAQEQVVSDLDEAKTPDSHHGAVAIAADDGDSSNDDSSYFADPSNLPSPKSGGRKYSFSSHQSATHPTQQPSSVGNPKESDASLSLSDSDDEDHHHSDSGLYPPPRGTPDVYPHRIMRVHSVGSLMSTSSQNSSEDPIIHEELNQATAARNYANMVCEIPSGRLSPVQAGHFASPTSHLTQASPPTIMPYQFQYQQNYLHPRVQSAMTPSEEWISSLANQPQPPQQLTSVYTTGSGWSDGTLNYSDDGDMHGFQHNMNQKGQGGGQQTNSSNNMPSGRNQASNSRQRNAGGSRTMPPKTITSSSRGESGDPDDGEDDDDGTYRVYWQRWIMLLYMSVLNLLSDWTCYSVAPIALLTQQAFGNINPEELVVVFLGANAVSSACEPIILSRLGLRRTVLFGALLLMIGSIVKSGGMPPIIDPNLEKGSGEWRVYLGFFLVGLSQPLYQCTPALLSASWFPEKERTMATGVALNANQLGIGFAFIFGTLLVANSDDIPGYFGLLSQISTITFFGALFQFDDAPPTPPSQTARTVRGDLDLRLPSMRQVLESIGISGRSDVRRDVDASVNTPNNSSARNTPSGSRSVSVSRRNKSAAASSSSKKQYYKKAPSPSSAPWDDMVAASAPSPMMPGSVGNATSEGAGNEEKEEAADQGQQQASASGPYAGYGPPPYYGTVPPPPPQMGYPMYAGMPYNPNPANVPYGEGQQGTSQFGGMQQGTNQYGSMQQGTNQFGGMQQSNNPYGVPPYPGSHQSSGGPYGQEGGMPPPPYGFPPPGYPPYPMPFFDPRSGQYVYPPPPPTSFYPPPHGHGDPYGNAYMRGFGNPYGLMHQESFPYEGAEPVVTVTPHHLDIDIRDDQVLLSIRACYARPGFIHALVSFTVSGIVINTLSTFMDYLVRLNGAGREMTGIVGGTFQFVIMISSLVIGGMTDRSRAYYSVTVGMLVLGAFGLAECGVSLNADRGGDLRFALVIVALLVGPLQPVSTELAVEVVYPLSENTVLVIQQLFANLLSALFIPCFKKMKDIGINQIDASVQQPEYTFSFYLLIVLHAAATVFFATFNGRYLRYEHELQRKEEQERKEEERNRRRSFSNASEKQPLMQQQHPLV